MSDYMIRAVAADDRVRAFAATSKEMVEFARRSHGTSPVITAALGRTLTAAVMMGSMMKGEKDMLTLQLLGEGPSGGITVTADSNGHVKGFANKPQVYLPPRKDGKLDVGTAVGPGILRVMKDIGLKDPYVGTVEIRTGEIAEDLTYYFAVSEQTPSSVGLGVLVDVDESVLSAGGFIIQLMPGTPDEVVDILEKNIGELPSVTAMLSDGMTPEDIMEKALKGLSPSIMEKKDISFKCDCSRDRIIKTLSSLSEEDMDEMIDAGEDIEVKCHFCNGAYIFSPRELSEIKEERKKRG
ncbi:MAG: Hsp33 family molecular chaperone HslO [Lachnospiraceae bacterium]|nr:Hsp33 family molecular chaperone HslO [Lachnospiraceae bacterium]